MLVLMRWCWCVVEVCAFSLDVRFVVLVFLNFVVDWVLRF